MEMVEILLSASKFGAFSSSIYPVMLKGFSEK